MSATVHPVVTAEWLLQNITHPDLVVVDCSWDEKEDMEVSYKRWVDFNVKKFPFKEVKIQFVCYLSSIWI